MTVFTLHHCIDYEGDILMGIYATRERAEAALEEAASDMEWHDREDLVITEMEVQ
jgi:hypothetical protein